MQSNLHRARNSFGLTRSSSMSSMGSRQTEHVSEIPAIHQRQVDGPPSPAKHREKDTFSLVGNAMGHSRVFSETSVPSSLQTLPPKQENAKGPRRASSAMGLRGISPSFRTQNTADTPRTSARSSLTRTGSFSNRHNKSLEPLHEHGPAPDFSSDKFAQENPKASEQPPSKLEQNKGSVGGALTRSGSNPQIRELRDQMQDLKGKISSLKERTREDSLRRRSLQSLKTPNPFTAADQWYSGPEVNFHRHNITNDGSATFALEKARKAEDLQIEQQAGIPNSKLLAESVEPDIVVEDSYAKMSPESQEGNWFHDELDKSPSAGVEQPSRNRFHEPFDNLDRISEADSLLEEQDYHESSPSPIRDRHEDRADAFDYEHFYLDSGMGNFSRRDVGRSDSRASTDSAETTKPGVSNRQSSESTHTPRKKKSSSEEPHSSNTNHKQSNHGRKTSVDSVSTVRTFATATEGAGSDQDDMNDMPQMAGSWQPDRPTVHKPRRPQREVFQGNAVKHSDFWNNEAGRQLISDSSGFPHITQPPTPISTNRTLPVFSVPELASVLLRSCRTREGQTHQVQLSDEDQVLVERLTESLMIACTQLDTLNHDRGSYENKIWRGRLGAARRVLDGEMNGGDSF